MHVSGRGAARTGVQQQMALALQRLEGDLRQTAAGGVTVAPATADDPAVTVGIFRLLDVMADGRQVWDRRLLLYTWSGTGGSLVRKVVDPSAAGVAVFDSQPTPITAAQLAALAKAPGEDERVLVRDVDTFRVALGGGDDTARPCSLYLRAGSAEASGTRQALESSRVVSVRNRT